MATPTASQVIEGAMAEAVAVPILAMGELVLPPSARGIKVTILDVPDRGEELLSQWTAPVSLVRFTAKRSELAGMGAGYSTSPSSGLDPLEEYLLAGTTLPKAYETYHGPAHPERRTATIIATPNNNSEVIVLSFRTPR